MACMQLAGLVVTGSPNKESHHHACLLPGEVDARRPLLLRELPMTPADKSRCPVSFGRQASHWTRI